jgi:hypothetical protein
MKEIQLTQGKVALVDDEDYEWLSKYKWYYHHQGYASTYYKVGFYDYKNPLMHRLILGVLDNLQVQVDHINGNKLDNRRENIRIVDQATNSKNLHKKTSNRTTKYIGVYKYPESHRRTKPFYAYITCDTIREVLGYFLTAEEAALAYNKRAEELGFLTRNIIETKKEI